MRKFKSSDFAEAIYIVLSAINLTDGLCQHHIPARFLAKEDFSDALRIRYQSDKSTLKDFDELLGYTARVIPWRIHQYLQAVRDDFVEEEAPELLPSRININPSTFNDRLMAEAINNILTHLHKKENN